MLGRIARFLLVVSVNVLGLELGECECYEHDDLMSLIRQSCKPNAGGQLQNYIYIPNQEFHLDLECVCYLSLSKYTHIPISVSFCILVQPTEKNKQFSRGNERMRITRFLVLGPSEGSEQVTVYAPFSSMRKKIKLLNLGRLLQ